MTTLFPYTPLFRALYADTIIAAKLLNKKDWGNYDMPVNSLNSIPWAAAVRLDEAGSPFAKQLSAMFTDMNRSGYFLEREKAWGLPVSQFLLDLHKKAMAKQE